MRRNGRWTAGARGLALAAALLVAACSSKQEPPKVSADEATARTIAQGQVVGFVSGEESQVPGVHVWRGIPFAAPPVGELRWRAPRPAEPWEGTRQTLEFGPRCPQITNALNEGEGLEPGLLIGSEDCLTLNVYAPADADGDLPVMLWIHGGGNVWGRASNYDATNLAQSQNVVVVTIQYRIGPFGWFAHGALRDTAQTEDDASANFGTLDMIAALEWVRDNISTFGGDPDLVTIFGESAGGHNVASLLGSERAAGLFHRAILQSGSFRTMDVADAENGDGIANPARKVTGRMLAAAGQSTPADEEALVAFLQGVSMEKVFDAYEKVDASSGLLTMPRVIADGVTLPREGLMAALDSPGGFNDVPVMSGTNRDEMKLFNMLNPDYVNRYFGIILTVKDKVMYDVIADYQSRMWRVLAVDEPFGRMVSGGHDEIYAYRFDWDEEGSFLFSDFSRLLGAGHAVEIPFVFGRFKMFGRLDPIIFNDDNEEARLALSDTMMSRWAEFARTGRPGGGWGRWEDGRYLVLDTYADGGVRMAQGAITTGSVLADLETDERLETVDQRCEVFARTMETAPEVASYRGTFLDGACMAE